MRLPQSNTQSGGALYRRVVHRNILCTICIVVAYIITTLVVVLAILGASRAVRPILVHVDDSNHEIVVLSRGRKPGFW